MPPFIIGGLIKQLTIDEDFSSLHTGHSPLVSAAYNMADTTTGNQDPALNEAEVTAMSSHSTQLAQTTTPQTATESPKEDEIPPPNSNAPGAEATVTHPETDPEAPILNELTTVPHEPTDSMETLLQKLNASAAINGPSEATEAETTRKPARPSRDGGQAKKRTPNRTPATGTTKADRHPPRTTAMAARAAILAASTTAPAEPSRRRQPSGSTYKRASQLSVLPDFQSVFQLASQRALQQAPQAVTSKARHTLLPPTAHPDAVSLKSGLIPTLATHSALPQGAVKGSTAAVGTSTSPQHRPDDAYGEVIRRRIAACIPAKQDSKTIAELTTYCDNFDKSRPESHSFGTVPIAIIADKSAPTAEDIQVAHAATQQYYGPYAKEMVQNARQQVLLTNLMAENEARTIEAAVHCARATEAITA